MPQAKTNEEKGIILGMKPPTVKNRVQRILEKLGLENRTRSVKGNGFPALKQGRRSLPTSDYSPADLQDVENHR